MLLSLTLRDREAVVSKGEARAQVFTKQVFTKAICGCPAPKRARERTCIVAIRPDLITVYEMPPIFSETVLAALRSSAAMALASAAGV